MFGPSPPGLGKLLWPLLTPAAPSRRLAAPVAHLKPGAGRQASQGKTRDLRPTYPPHIRPDPPGDIGLWVFTPPRPGSRRLLCGSCSSGQDFACSFLQTPPRGDALAVRLTVPVTRARRGLPPPSRPTHHHSEPTSAVMALRAMPGARGKKIEENILNPTFQAIQAAIEQLEQVELSETANYDSAKASQLKNPVAAIQTELNKLIDAGLYEDSSSLPATRPAREDVCATPRRSRRRQPRDRPAAGRTGRRGRRRSVDGVAVDVWIIPGLRQRRDSGRQPSPSGIDPAGHARIQRGIAGVGTVPDGCSAAFRVLQHPLSPRQAQLASPPAGSFTGRPGVASMGVVNAEDDRQRDRRRLLVEPDAHDGAVED